MAQLYKKYTWIIIVALLFFCKGASLGMLMQPEHHAGMNALVQSDHAHTNTAKDMSCCTGTAESQFQMDHTLPMLLTTLVALVITLLVLFVGYSTQRAAPVQKIYLYLLSVKDRYGGFRLWDQYQYLFQKGILHPRIW